MHKPNYIRDYILAETEIVPMLSYARGPNDPTHTATMTAASVVVAAAALSATARRI